MSPKLLSFWSSRQGRLQPNSVSAYLFAAFCVAVASLFRLAFSGQITLLYASYYVAVLVVSLVGGFYVSVFAVMLSSIATWWLFIPPAFEFGALSATQAINMTFFVAMSLAIAGMGNLNRVLLADLTKQRDHGQLLLEELRHRNKNMRMVVQAIILQTLTNTPQREALLNRIGSLALLDELRTRPDQQSVDLQQIAQRLLEPFQGRASIQGPPLLLDSILAKVSVLMLHELVANAVKYGALSRPEGNVVLTWSVDDNVTHISWREIGGPPVVEPKRRGTGLLLTERLAKSVNGQLSSKFGEVGVVHQISFPLPTPRATPGRCS